MNRIKVLFGSLVGILTFAPAFAFAQQNFTLSNGIQGALTNVGNILNLIVPILIALGIIAFLYGVLKFIFAAGDPEKRKEGRSFMIWGLVGIVVMVSVWGLVTFIQRSFGINQGGAAQTVQLPQVQ